MIRVKKAQFLIKYEGLEDNYHELDAALLSRALMAFSEMGRIAYREAHPEDTHTLNVKVQALQAGSFEVALEASVPAIEHLYGQVVGLFNKPDAIAASNAYGIAGAIGGAFGVVKWIAGRNHKTKSNGDKTEIVTDDGDRTTVPTVTYNIAGNATFITAAENAMAPLDDPHYDRMLIKGSDGRVLDTTHEDDRGYFKNAGDELALEETLTLEVGIVTVQVSAPQRVWTFVSGNQRFNARVLDEEFTEFMQSQGYLVNAQTKALVQRREIRKRDSNGVTTSKFYIDKVIQISNPGEEPKRF